MSRETEEVLICNGRLPGDPGPRCLTVCVFAGAAGEGRLRPSASVLGHVRMEAHLRAADSSH